MNNTIQVKAYLIPKSVSKVNEESMKKVSEIRRFVLTTTSWTGSYNELLNSIHRTFGSFVEVGDKNKNNNMLTYWEDDESELVGFSSDEEMRYAVEILTNVHLSRPVAQRSAPFIFKIYIREQKQEQRDENNLHIGFNCDGCEGTITGCRYKCLSCADYDLCEKCKEKNVHAETGHKFNEIKTPIFTFDLFGRGGSHRFNRINRRCHRQRHCHQTNDPISSLLGSSMPLPNENDVNKFCENLQTFITPLVADFSTFVETESKKSSEKKEEATKSQSEAKQSDVEPKPSENKEEKKPVSPYNDIFELIKSFDVINTPKENDSNADKSTPSAANVGNTINNIINSLPNIAAAINSAASVNNETKVKNAVEHLKTMGYKDDEGWLTRLAISKNGNINDILDAITPKI
jgi:hypothetical protein